MSGAAISSLLTGSAVKTVPRQYAWSLNGSTLVCFFKPSLTVSTQRGSSFVGKCIEGFQCRWDLQLHGRIYLFFLLVRDGLWHETHVCIRTCTASVDSACCPGFFLHVWSVRPRPHVPKNPLQRAPFTVSYLLEPQLRAFWLEWRHDISAARHTIISGLP